MSEQTGPDFDVAREFNRKMASLEADRQIAELTAAKRPPVVIRNGAWLNKQQFGAVSWAVPGIMPEGMTFLGGAPKIGKSWLALSVGLSVSAGSVILGSLGAVPARPVLYLALEDGDRRMKARCALLGWNTIPVLFEYATQASPRQALDTCWHWLWQHRAERPLVIIDTWGKICPPALKGETTYDRDYRLGGNVKALTDSNPGSSVLVNHHIRKAGAEDFIDLLSGTQGVAGSADTILILTGKRGEDTARLQVTGRDVNEETYQLTGRPFWALGDGGLAGAASLARATADRDRLGDRSSEILDLIDKNGRLTTAEIAGLLQMDSDKASTYLGRLVKAGKINRISRGLYESLVSTVGSVGTVGNPNTTISPNTGYKSEHDFNELYNRAEGL